MESQTLRRSASFGWTSSFDSTQMDKINAIPNKTSDNILMDGLSPEDRLYLDALIDIELQSVDDDNISHRSSTWSPMIQSPMMEKTRIRKLRPNYAVTLSLKDISYIRPLWGISKGVKNKRSRSKSSLNSETESDKSSSKSNHEPAYHYFLSVLTIIVFCLIVTTYLVDRRNERDSIQLNRVNISIGQKSMEFYRPNIETLERILRVQIAQSIPRDLRPDRCTCKIYSAETKRYDPNTFRDDDRTCFACFDWAFRANLRVFIDRDIVMPDNDNVNGISDIDKTFCYHIKWQSYDALQTPLVDCFLIDHLAKEQWFGLGDLQTPNWSLNELQFDWTPLVTNLSAEFRHTHTAKAASNQLALGSHVDYSLFSTKGIYVGNINTDFETSFKIMNDTKSGAKRMCLSASCTDKCSQTWARIDHLERLRYHNNYLEYSICTSSDIDNLISHQMRRKINLEYDMIKDYKFMNEVVNIQSSSSSSSSSNNNNTSFGNSNSMMPIQTAQNTNLNQEQSTTIKLNEKLLERESTLNSKVGNSSALDPSTISSSISPSSNSTILSTNDLSSMNSTINQTNPTSIPSNTTTTTTTTINLNPEVSLFNVQNSSSFVVNVKQHSTNNPEQELPESIDLIERIFFFVSRDYMTTLDGQTLRQYIDNVTNLNLNTQQILLIDTRWEVYIGSLKLNNGLFPKANQLFELIHGKGFKVLFTIKPYIDSGIGVSNINQLFKNGRLYTANYKKDTHMEFGFQAKEISNIKESLIRRKSLFTFNTQPIEIGLNDTIRFPYQFKCRESREGYCVLLDLTQQSNRIWFISNIKRSNLFTVKADGLQIGGAHPNRFYWDDNYRQGVSELARYLMYKENLYTLPQWTGDFNYIQLAPRECNWNGLKSIVNSVINVGMMGYSLVHPGSVWGDLKKTAEVVKPPVQTSVLANYRMESILDDEDIDENSTEEELIIRWLQISMFMPILQFNNILPIERHNLQDLLKNLTTMRREYIVPEMQKHLPFTPLVNQSRLNIDVFLPLIRPVYLDGLNKDGKSAVVVPEQFSVGPDLVVAPIMNAGQKQRDIYLPKGIWRDELRGVYIRGSRWYRNYLIELRQIAWFSRARKR